MNINDLKGFHAEISFGISPNNREYIKKTFGKLYQLSSTKAITDLIRKEKEFQEKAKSLDIPIVPSQHYYIMPSDRNTHVYIEIQKYMKYNFHDALLHAKTSDVLYVLLAQYLSSLQKSWQSEFLVSLDPVVRNFGIDEDGVVRYFDFFPPRQRLDDGSYFEWPKPEEGAREIMYMRYFTSGQAQVIYSQLLRVLQIERVLTLTEIKQLIGGYLGSEAYHMIDLPSSYREKIITQPAPSDVDALRIIAAEMCYREELSQESMSVVYKLTHISQDNTLPKRKDVQIAALLISQKLRHNQIERISA